VSTGCVQQMSDLDSIDRGVLLRFAATAAALIGTGLRWRSGLTGHWSPMVAEWLGFVGAMGIVVFPIAAYFVIDGCLALRRASAAVNWPRARGTIESSAVRRGGRGFYFADVSYRYAVEGASFTSDAIQSARMGCSKVEAHEIAARYPVGAEVDVRYDPRAHGSSMLELGPGAARGRMILAGVMFAAPIIFATLGVWHNSYD